MDKIQIDGKIANLEGRLEKLDRMRELYAAEGNEAGASRTAHRITEVVEDLHDLRQARSEFDERDGQIRTGAE